MPSSGRRHGADFEKRLARDTDGYRHPGLDGDVETRQRWRLEAKYRVGLQLESGHTLRDWLDQVYRYVEKWPKGKRWALVITGGKSYRNGAVFVLVTLAEWQRLVALDKENTDA